MFDELAHPSSCDTSAAKDLDGICCSLLRCTCRIHLQECDLAGEVVRLLLVAHVVHLVRDVLEPVRVLPVADDGPDLVGRGVDLDRLGDLAPGRAVGLGGEGHEGGERRRRQGHFLHRYSLSCRL